MYKLLIKVVLIFVIFLSCVCVGVLISNYYKKRKTLFSDFLSFLEFSSGLIKHSNEKISVIIDKYNKNEREISLILYEFKKFIDNKKTKEDFLIDLKRIAYFLKEEEIQLLFCILVELGSFDEYGELNKLEINKKIIDNKVLKSTNESGKFSPFFIKMGVLLGAFLFVIFV